MAFLSTFIMSLRISFCSVRFRGKLDFLWIFVTSIFCTSGVLLEDPSRGEEYAIFTFPKVLQGFWNLFKKFGIVNDIPYSTNMIFAISMAVMLYFKKYHNSDMPASYRNQLSFVYGGESAPEAKVEDKKIFA